MKKFKLIVPSFVALIFCMLLIAGSTFALFTSQASASITATSGRVQVSAQFDASSLKVYSAKAVDTIGTDDVEAGIITSGDFAGKYIFDEQHRTSGSYHLFANNPDNTEAGALLENGKLSLIKMTPGDKVTAKLKLVNNSNVNIKYRVKVSLESGLKLFEGLQIKLDGVLLQGVAKTGTWTFLAAPALDQNGDPIDNMGYLSIEVLLPLLAGNEYQDLSTKLNFVVEAVQANAKTVDETLNTNVEVTEQVSNTGTTVLSDNEGLVTASVPTETLKDNTNTITLSVKPTDSDYNIVATSEQTAQAYDVKVLLANSQTTAIKEDNETEITVNMFIGKDLKGVQLYHNGVAMAADKWSYDSESGIVTFKTNSFSEYAVVYNKDLVVETVNPETKESTFTTYEATETTGVYTKTTVNPTTQQEVVETVIKTTDQNGNAKAATQTGEAYLVHDGKVTFKDTLRQAIEDAVANDTVVLIKKSHSADGYLIEKNLNINVNGNTIEVENGSSYNYRAFKIQNGAILNVYGGGKIDAQGQGTTDSNGSGCFGAFRVEVNSELHVSDLTLTNARPWGLNVKVCGGRAYLENVTINSNYGGGIEVTEVNLGNKSTTGYAEVKNCTFTQVGYFDHCSSCLAVSGGSQLVVNGGSYTSEKNSLYVFSSGGIITVNNGTFNGKITAEIDLNTYAGYTGGLQLNGGTYNGEFTITSPAYMVINAGTFNNNPTQYVANTSFVEQKSENSWVVTSNFDVVKAAAEEYGLTVSKVGAESGNNIYAEGKFDNDATLYRYYQDGELYIVDASEYAGTSYVTRDDVDGILGWNNNTVTELTINSNLKQAYKVFSGNTSLTSVIFGENATCVPNRMFYGLSGVKEINLPATVKRIEDFAFYGNTAIESIIAADLDYVGYKAFDGCSKLKTVDLGGDNLQIMGLAGRGTTIIETVIIRGSNVTVNLDYAPANQAKGSYVFCREQSGNPSTNNGLTIYVANDNVASQFSYEFNSTGAIRGSLSD